MILDWLSNFCESEFVLSDDAALVAGVGGAELSSEGAAAEGSASREVASGVVGVLES